MIAKVRGLWRSRSITLLAVVILAVGAACGGDQEPTLFRKLMFFSRGTGDYDIRLRTSNERLPLELGRVLPWDSQPSWSPDGTRIAFYSDRNFNLPDRDNNVDIYVMDAGGGELTRLTDDRASDAFPHWSPDGQRIAFYSDRDDNGEIYVMNADGSGLTRLTDNDAVDIPYGWSPDGQSVVFTSARKGTLDLFLLDVDDGGVRRLTKTLGQDVAAVWSPDGSRIAFESIIGGNSDIFVVNVDGSREEVNWTVKQLRDAYPAWAPDGVRLAFVSDRTADVEIYVLDTNFSFLKTVTDSPREDAWPAWSPDGTRIAFVSNRDFDREVYVANADGTGVTRMTNDLENSDLSPAWSPDGSRIAFVKAQGGGFVGGQGSRRDVYVVNADGSGLVRLTNDDGQAASAAGASKE